MTLLTPFQYLFFSRQAIVRIAECKQAVWIGLLFVLSAGFAREYDGEDLLHEPWHLLIPLAASLATSWILFSLVFLAARAHHLTEGSYWQLYRRFLGLYWMTAPLAWLYAIPVERFMSAGDATQTNLILLGIVSLWRVLLMIRVVSVVFGASTFQAFSLVLFFADTVVITLLFLTPLPVISIMGGVRLSDSEQILQATAMLVGFFSIVSWLLWLIFFVAVLISNRPWTLGFDLARSDVTPTRPLWALATAAIAVWALVLPVTQPEQQLRHRAEFLLYAGQYADALGFMSQYEQADFPPHWDAPPHTAYHDPRPPLMDVVECAAQGPVKPWVWEMYLDKYHGSLESSFSVWHHLDETEITRRMDLLESLSEEKQLALLKGLEWTLQELALNETISPELAARAKALHAKVADENLEDTATEVMKDLAEGEPPEPEEDSLPD